MLVVRVRPNPGGVDKYGDRIPGDASRLELDGCGVAPRYSNDLNEPGRNGVMIGLTVFAPFNTDIVNGDQVEIDGALYDIEGDVGAWHQFMTGWNAGKEIALRRAEG